MPPLPEVNSKMMPDGLIVRFYPLECIRFRIT
jgi:hypothetical protein